MLFKKTSSFIVALSISTITLIADKEVDISQAREIVSKIYKETNENFLWLKERKPDNKKEMKLYYGKFFTESLSNMLANKLSNGGILHYFREDGDPRFPLEVHNIHREKILKLKIHNPTRINQKKVTVRVDYKTDQTDGETCVTVYFLSLEKNHWLIDDQDLGLGYSIKEIKKNQIFKPDLRMFIEGQDG